MLQLTNRRNGTQAQIMRWHLQTGTKPSGIAQRTGSIQDKCLFLLSEFTTAPVILHSGAAFSRQGQCPIYCCKRKPARGTRMPAVRMMPYDTGASFPGLESQLPHQGLIPHTLVMINCPTLAETSLCVILRIK